MKHFAKRISAMLILALGFAWGAEALHTLMIPHFYCAEHQSFAHEGHDHLGTNSVQSEHADHHDEEGCDLTLFSHPTGVVVASNPVVTSFSYQTAHYPLLSRSIMGTGRFRLAPKNSPPA